MSTIALHVGTPLWKKPLDPSGTKNANTKPPAPSATTEDHTEFLGVTIREGEIFGDGRQIQVNQSIEMLARVVAPCKAGDTLCLTVGKDYLTASSELDSSAKQISMGVAIQGIKEGDVNPDIVDVWLIKVQRGASSGEDVEVTLCSDIGPVVYVLKGHKKEDA
jgi:hypothetical protein